MPNFRVRSIPVLGTTPAFFGIAAAAHILCHLAKQVRGLKTPSQLWVTAGNSTCDQLDPRYWCRAPETRLWLFSSCQRPELVQCES